MTIGVLSHLLCAISYGALFLLLLTSWRGRLQGRLLLLATGTTLLWAIGCILYLYSGFRYYYPLYVFFEVCRNALWLVFLFQLLNPLALGQRTVKSLAARYFYPSLAAYSALVIALDLNSRPLAAWLPFAPDLIILGHIAFALLGLVLVEQLFRNTRLEQRWATKFIYIGVGGLFAYDLFLYADALLFRRIDGNVWSARGLVYAMTPPIIALSAARNPEWSLDIFVSRRMVIHTASLMGASIYLFVMAGVGYYIRYFGGSWGSAIQLSFLFGALFLLLAMMFSGQVRAHLKRFINRHFFYPRYDYRAEWQKFNRILSMGESTVPLRDRPVRAMAEMLDCNGGFLWNRTHANYFSLISVWNMAAPLAHREPADSPLVRFLETEKMIIDTREIAREPELYSQLSLPEWLSEHPRAAIVIPLLKAEQVSGFVVLDAPHANPSLHWEDRELMHIAGQQVAHYIALLDATDALMNSRQFEAFNRLSAFIVHDLKNVVAQLNLVTTNAKRYRDNPEFVDDAFHTMENATARMNRMLVQLKKGPHSAPPEEVTIFSLFEAMATAIANCQQSQPTPHIAECDPTLQLRCSRERLIAILEHLLQNAQEATPDTGEITLSARSEQGEIVVEIRDTGCGMSEQFIRESLFRPFMTTKGNAGMGIGVFEAREFMINLEGDIDVASQEGVGTTFFLRFPARAVIAATTTESTPLVHQHPETAYR